MASRSKMILSDHWKYGRAKVSLSFEDRLKGYRRDVRSFEADSLDVPLCFEDLQGELVVVLRRSTRVGGDQSLRRDEQVGGKARTLSISLTLTCKKGREDLISDCQK
jgi:hypothetical protein